MSLKNKFQPVIFSILMVVSSLAFAGKEGVSMYYGLGLGAASVTDSGLDPAAAAELILGIEEDGWAVEYTVFRSAETGTDISTIDYTVSGTQTVLAYRTVESGGMYYKIKYGNADADIDFSDTTATVVTDGNVYGLGMGMRMGRDERLELEYNLYSSDDMNDVHMLVLRYMFGGSTGNGK